ncbi:MAG: tRNA(fMet)-specific endonuclease VapC [Spirosomataceae bacterium]|jgi:tRNA(fMet)-specific endonuclease VapC
MAKQVILLDTSILIDYYRKTDKSNSVWINLIDEGFDFAISVVTKYELFAGAKPKQIEFWETVLQNISIIPFDEDCVDTAIRVNTLLKKSNKQIEIADLFIASTALSNNLSTATLNKKHFERVDELEIVK